MKFTGRYTAATAKALKGSPRLVCQVTEDGTIYICNGFLLCTMNAPEYAGRYKTDADTTTPEMPSVPPLVQEREREDQHEKLLPWHYKLAKLIDCEIYQASEDATRKDPLLLALIDFSRVYTHFLVSNTADYNAAPWGTI